MESLPLFVNHYQTKLQINNIFFDIHFVLIFTLLLLITSRKSLNEQPLSFLQTSQMRGLGITLIILNHICYYTDPPPSLYVIWSEAGMIGVAIFLILSGYGLCISLETKGVQNFFTNRISKILIPLILALSLLQFLYLALTPEGGTILLALPRILFSMCSLDAKTWFIIFILFWYCLLYLTYKFELSNKQRLLFLLVVSCVIISLPQASSLAKANAFSFPFGCWIGLNSSWIQAKINQILHQKIIIIIPCLIGSILGSGFLIWHVGKFQYNSAYSIILWVLLICIGISTFYFGYLYFFKQVVFRVSSEVICSTLVIALIYLNYTSQVFEQNILGEFNIYWGFVRSCANIFFASTLMLLVSLTIKFQIYSLLLSFLGNISLELFLIHNTFLVHFDFFLFRLPIVIGFVLYFLMVCLLSIVFKQLSTIIIKRCFTS
ncbi:MAG: acyltransferase family protein [Mastigocoleus sp. MO_167.B18]|nr:acyltransferase family protein [Mastigocoleus sp. MO_167.B18]